MTITFKTHENFTAFMNMAEGQWLNYRDDNQEPDFGIVDRLMDELDAAWKTTMTGVTNDVEYQAHYPMTLPLSATTLEMAQSVLENCLQYSEDGYDPDDEPVIKKGEVTIQ